jgi:hypothetical protein
MNKWHVAKHIQSKNKPIIAPTISESSSRGSRVRFVYPISESAMPSHGLRPEFVPRQKLVILMGGHPYMDIDRRDAFQRTKATGRREERSCRSFWKKVELLSVSNMPDSTETVALSMVLSVNGGNIRPI